MNVLQHFIARRENVLDAVQMLCERRVDIVRTLCALNILHFRHISQRSHSAKTYFAVLCDRPFKKYLLFKMQIFI